MEIFDIKNCVSEMCNILSDKADIKQIEFKTEYLKFENNYLLKSD